MGKCECCKYYLTVKGKRHSKKLCLGNIKAYRSGTRALNEPVDILELILLLGKEKLENMIRYGGQHLMACGEFAKRIQ